MDEQRVGVGVLVGMLRCIIGVQREFRAGLSDTEHARLRWEAIRALRQQGRTLDELEMATGFSRERIRHRLKTMEGRDASEDGAAAAVSGR